MLKEEKKILTNAIKTIQIKFNDNYMIMTNFGNAK